MRLQPILSICIPTYNRLSCLKQSLERILEENTDCEEGKVEIIISDNGSTDETWSYLEAMGRNYPQLKISRNDLNLGFDYNVMKLFCAAKGKYIWLFSDDDCLYRNNLNQIITALERDVSLIYIPPKAYRPEAMCKDNFISEQETFAFQKYDNPNEALRKVGWLCTYLTSFIMKKGLISNNFLQYIGRGFIHTPMVLDCCAHGNIIVVTSPCLAMRTDNGGGYNRYRYFGINIYEIFKSYTPVFGRASIRNLTKGWIKGCVRNNVIRTEINVNKGHGYNKNRSIYLLFAYYSYPIFWIQVFPFLVIPDCILRSVFKLYIKAKNINYDRYEYLFAERKEK